MAKPAPTEHRYAICIGINQYSPTSGLAALRYAEQDAQAMHDVFGHLDFPPENCKLLCGKQATLEMINTVLADIILDKAGINDLIVFYFAGHSIPLAVKDVDDDGQRHSEVFLTTYDFDRRKILNGRAFRLQQALGMERLRRTFFEGEGPRKRFFLFDSCYSGDFYGLSYRDEVNPVQGYIKHMLDSTSAGRVALSSCLPTQKATEDSSLSHGRFTYYVLNALRGEASEALREDGWITVNSLFDYVADQLPPDQRPVLSGVQHDTFKLVCYPDKIKNVAMSKIKEQSFQQKSVEKVKRLETMLASHQGFFKDRLASFVGREYELSEVHQRIVEKRSTGGYVTITGQAGQGKSSIIAKLVEEYIKERGPKNVAFHFIPFRPGPDHQISLLRNLMARLILRYDLSDIYVVSESRAALRDYFPRVLEELTAKGGQEVIFIDGLDQLEEDFNGRDLSFLPDNPPQGVVFVLGTRPDDTLRPLELLKPHYEYKLPNLSRPDFDLILQHRKVSLNKELADRFYETMQKNALYLDLVAKELFEAELTNQIEVIERVASDPNNIFTLSIERLRRQEQQWYAVLKPILGLLLASKEPLGIRTIRHILGIDDEEIRKGLRRLGGLIAEDGLGRRYLFHLKLRDYLHQDEVRPDKEYVFANDEEIFYHKKLVQWCENKELTAIWQSISYDEYEDNRRNYVRKYYIAHLYLARDWEKIWAIIDESTYGQAKLRYDPSTRLYAQDLDFARQAAASETRRIEDQVLLLPRLWRYTLLRCSLTSRADTYTPETFEALLLLQHDEQALGVAELLTNLGYKAQILLRIAIHIRKRPNREKDAAQLINRAHEVAKSIRESRTRIKNLVLLITKLADASLWEQAVDVAESIEDKQERTRALIQIGTNLIKAQQWDQAKALTHRIEEKKEQVKLLISLGSQIAHTHQQEELAKAIWNEANIIIQRIEEKEEQTNLLYSLNISLSKAQQWEYAEVLIKTIEDPNERIRSLMVLSTELVREHQWEQANVVWDEIRTVIERIEERREQARLLLSLGSQLAEAQQKARAEAVWDEIRTVIERVEERREQARLLLSLSSQLAEAQQKARAEAVWDKIIDLLALAENAREAEIMRKEAEYTERDIQQLRERTILLFQSAIELDKVHASKHAQVLWRKGDDHINNIKLRGKIEDKNNALMECCFELIKAGYANKVVELTNLIQGDREKAKILSELSIVLAKSHEWNQAIDIMRRVGTSISRRHAISAIFEIFIISQQWDYIDNIMHMIHVSDQRENLLLELGLKLVAARQWNWVGTIANMVDGIEAKARLLSAFGIALAKAHQWSRVQGVLGLIEIDQEKAKVLVALGVELSHVGLWEQAKKTWSSILLLNQPLEFIGERARSLIEFGTELIKAHLWEQARLVTRLIEPNEGKMQLLTVLGIELAKAQLWEQAQSVASEIEGEDKRTQVLVELGCGLAKAQLWEQAHALSRVIHSQWGQTKVLVSIGTELAETYQWYQVKDIVGQIQEPWGKARVLTVFGTKLGKVPQWSKVVSLVGMIERSEEKEWVLIALSNEFAKAQEWKQAEVVTRMLNDGERVSILVSLSTELIKARQWDGAEDMIRRIEDDEAKTRQWVELGKGLAKAQLWNKVEAVIHFIDLSQEQDKILVELGCILAQNRLLDRAEAIALRIEEHWCKTRVLVEIGCEFAKAGLWDQAKTIANKIEDFNSRIRVLVKLGSELIKAHYWNEAIELAYMMEKMGELVKPFTDISIELIKAQQWHEAERIACLVEINEEKAKILKSIAQQLKIAGEHELLIHMLHKIWLQATDRTYIIDLMPMATGLLTFHPEISSAFYEAFTWVENFLTGSNE